MFLFGFLVGFLVCLASVITSFLVWSKILPKYGRQMERIISKKLNEFDEAIKPQSEIINPNFDKEIFEAEGSKPDDFLK